jgi:eukaryotic-like serine/threonine-protein kinase
MREHRPIALDPAADSWTITSPSSSSDDPRVSTALEEYLAALRDGRRLSRSSFLERHSEISEALGQCLDGLEFVQSAARHLALPDEPSSDEAVLPPPICLGDFRIVRELGRGGMGIVYEAEQVSLGRRVALKVLPFASSIDPRQLRRFQVEAQAAAHLHHPHIVPIFAVGCDQGVHYYAMQLIEGRTLASLIQGMMRAVPDETHDSEAGRFLLADDATASYPVAVDSPPTQAATPAPGVSSPSTSNSAITEPARAARASSRMVALLGIQAANALEHAHSLGVLHRDVKPANLMITATGELWVTDFGLARFHEDVSLTRTNDLLGTLRYMSPEQARAGGVVVDHRTDIYSLGATLYELATLRPSFDGRDRGELLRQVTHDEPTAPRKIVPAIPRDLETIILKAMAKDVESRYFTAQELADDLRRFLEDKPVLARRPTPLEHLVKWTRRHRPAVTAAVTALILATTIAAGLLWREQLRTAKALADLEQMRDKERAALPKIFMDASDLTMTAMQKVSEVSVHDKSPIDVMFFRMAKEYYDGIIHLIHDDPDPSMRKIAAKANFGLGLSRMILREPGAEEAFVTSVEIYESLAARPPGDPDSRFQQAVSLNYLAKHILASRKMPAAEPTFLRSMSIARDLVSRFPDIPQYRNLLSSDLIEWAELMIGEKRRAEAERVFNELDTIVVDPGQVPMINNINNFAWRLAVRPESSPHEPASAVRLARRVVKLVPNEANFWNTLAMTLLRNGELEAASTAIDRAMSLRQDKDPADLLILALIRARQGDAEASRRYYNAAVGLIEKDGKPDPDLASIRAEAARLIDALSSPR